MIRVLVTAASKYGATAEIAATIAEVLRRARAGGHDALPRGGQAVDGYDAVVVGSAVYAGHWLKPARELVERHAGVLAGRPVWLFSSGPVGDPPKPEEDPVEDMADLVDLTNAREHRVFAGKLVRKQLSSRSGRSCRPCASPRGTSGTGPRSASGRPGSLRPSELASRLVQ